MQQIRALGAVPWTWQDLASKLREFAELYEQRPIRENIGGMKAPHMFAAWFTLQWLQPEYIIESGVWLGQGTWFFEQACPRASIICIEPELEAIRYRSTRATYLREDFTRLDWTAVPKDRTMVFFDDHQNAYERVKEMYWQGFQRAMFEDNYPASQGDCYSLKKAFMNAGFTPAPPPPPHGVRARVRNALLSLGRATPLNTGQVIANTRDAEMLQRNLAVYYEFPPVFKPPVTRWGDPWNDRDYPTPEPILHAVTEPWQQLYLDDATDYTWICYVELAAQRTML